MTAPLYAEPFLFVGEGPLFASTHSRSATASYSSVPEAVSHRSSSIALPAAAGSEALDRAEAAPRALLLFDGVCNLCNGFVNVILDADSEAYFRFGALQSDAARPYLQAFDLNPDDLSTVVLIEEGRVYTRSTAALRVLRRLDFPWPLLYAFIVVPRPLRDWVYDRIAERRYDWFGRRNECRVPTPELRDRFLEDPT